MLRPQPDDDPVIAVSDSEEDLFAQLPAYDVVDGELLPRSRAEKRG